MNKKHLNDMEWYVTQENGTEPPFTGQYDNFYEDGIYVDIVSGEVLFTSKDKYNAGCGWPAFTKPADQKNVTEHFDFSHDMKRVEVRSSQANSHLGHVFTDGPQEQGGFRYCINSAALRFIPKTDLEKEGYSQWVSVFE